MCSSLRLWPQILIFKQTLVGQVLCALTCVQLLVYTGCFWYYNRKY